MDKWMVDWMDDEMDGWMGGWMDNTIILCVPFERQYLLCIVSLLVYSMY